MSLKSVFDKDYNDLFLVMSPESYLNIHLLSYSYPNIPIQKDDNEIGYAKFNLSIHLFNKKDLLIKEYLSSGGIFSDKDKFKKLNGFIYPLLHFPVYLPLYNKKIDFDDKNFFRLSFIFLEAMQVFYQQYDYINNIFVSPDFNYGELIENNTMSIISKSINEHKIINKIEKEILKTVKTNDFINFDMNTLPKVYDLDDFLFLPKNINTLSKSDLDYLSNDSLNIQYKNRFLSTVYNMFKI